MPWPENNLYWMLHLVGILFFVIKRRICYINNCIPLNTVCSTDKWVMIVSGSRTCSKCCMHVSHTQNVNYEETIFEGVLCCKLFTVIWKIDRNHWYFKNLTLQAKSNRKVINSMLYDLICSRMQWWTHLSSVNSILWNTYTSVLPSRFYRGGEPLVKGLAWRRLRLRGDRIERAYGAATSFWYCEWDVE